MKLPFTKTPVEDVIRPLRDAITKLEEVERNNTSRDVKLDMKVKQLEEKRVMHRSESHRAASLRRKLENLLED